MAKRILFLHCGGTIGLESVGDLGKEVLTAPKDDAEFRTAILPYVQIFEKEHLDITYELLFTKDSTNISPHNWETIIHRVAKAQDEDGYDAIGITHGTDTLAYTATALALALHGREPGISGLRIPVCITGAQTSMYSLGSDSHFNLENLFKVLSSAIDHGLAEVMVNFWNRILLASRAVKVSEKDFDAFQSPSFPDIGRIDSRGVHFQIDHISLKEDAARMLSVAPRFENSIVAIELAPGVKPDIILNIVKSGNLKVLILKSLGEGNVCSEGEFNMLPVIKEITNTYAIPVLITTKFIGGSAVSAHYETGLLAIQAGAIPCLDHTDVAVDVKARWLLGNKICTDVEGVRRAMLTNYAGEVTSLR